nr:MAG TPA: hypothetical protein [Caudoviricetes sp.]
MPKRSTFSNPFVQRDCKGGKNDNKKSKSPQPVNSHLTYILTKTLSVHDWGQKPSSAR